MSNLSQIKIGSIIYNIKDDAARTLISDLNSALNSAINELRIKNSDLNSALNSAINELVDQSVYDNRSLANLIDSEGKNLLNPVLLARERSDTDKIFKIIDGDSIVILKPDYEEVVSSDGNMRLDAGTYTISLQNSVRCIIYANGSNVSDFTGTQNTFTVNSNNSLIFIKLLSSSSYPFTVGHVQIEKGSTATAYTRYTNFEYSDIKDIGTIRDTLSLRPYNYFNTDLIDPSYFQVDSNKRVTAVSGDFRPLSDIPGFIRLSAGYYCISVENSVRINIIDTVSHTMILETWSPVESYEFAIMEDTEIAIKFLSSSYPFVVGHVQIEKGTAPTTWRDYNQFGTCDYKPIKENTKDINSIHNTLSFRPYNYFNTDLIDPTCLKVDLNKRVTAISGDFRPLSDIPGFMELPEGTYCLSVENDARINIINAESHTSIIDSWSEVSSVSFTLLQSTLIAIKFLSSSYPFVVGHVQIEKGTAPTTWRDYNRFDVCEGRTLAITQTQIINSVEKQTIESSVEEVQTGRNASLYGVLPSNTAAENKANLQDLLNEGGKIIIDVPGVYSMNGRLEIYSNTELIFGKGVYIKRTESNDALLINHGALTREFDTDIIIDGLNLICDGQNGAPWNSIPGMRGQLTFHFVKNLTIRNFVCEDSPDGPYLCHFNKWENVLVENVRIVGIKDGLHFNTGERLIIRNAYIDTIDDCIALNAMDYPSGSCDLDWIRDVTIENVHNVKYRVGTPVGYVIRLISGSWTDWASGKMYRFSDTMVAPNGCVYRLIGPDTSTQEHASTVAPTVQSGSETTSDGLKWRFIQDYATYNCGVENVVIKNLHCEHERSNIIGIEYENSSFNRGVYPGTTPPLHKNILIDNVTTEAEVDTFISVEMGFEELKLINSCMNFANVIYDFAGFDNKGIVMLMNNVYQNSSNFNLVRATSQHRIDLYRSMDIVLNSNVTAAITGNVISH